jgi:hypothetical protein
VSESSLQLTPKITPRQPLVWVENSDDDDAPEEYRRLPSYPGSSPLTFPSSPEPSHAAASKSTSDPPIDFLKHDDIYEPIAPAPQPMTFPSSPEPSHAAASKSTSDPPIDFLKHDDIYEPIAPAPQPMTYVAPGGNGGMAVDSDGDAADDEYHDAFPEFNSVDLDQIPDLN